MSDPHQKQEEEEQEEKKKKEGDTINQTSMKGWVVLKEVTSEKPMARHWATPTHRFCVLKDSVLSLMTSDTSSRPVSEYSMRMANVSHHPYAKNEHSLVVRCHPLTSIEVTAELTLQFNYEIEYIRWLEALRGAINDANSGQREHADRALGALSSFMKERMFLRSRQVGDTSALERQIKDMSKTALFSSTCGDKKINFDAEMSMDNRVWKSSDYDARYLAEVQHSDDIRDDKEPQTEELRTSFQESHEVYEGEDDDYDFVDAQDYSDDSSLRSLTSYFGDVATALYRNASQSASSIPSPKERDKREKSNERSIKMTPPDAESSALSVSSNFAPPFAGHSSVYVSHLYCIPAPKLRILIMAVGTRGDVQPFALLGMQLLADGHRVRLATHSSYRDYVERFGGGGLEFFPLAGDPIKLSEFMVKTHGCILPSSPDIMKLVPENILMLNDIINSCWSACIEADPNAKGKHRKFQPDAIISNPVTYAHIHCAEALGVPLHLFFPQPWVPTKAFPHPLACMSYDRRHQWSTENFLSYQVVERMMWMSLEPFINAFRTKKLNLPPIRRGEHGWNLLNTNKVPFVKMWSRHLVPKPKDWGDHVDVVGFFVEKAKQDNKTSSTSVEMEQTSRENTTTSLKGSEKNVLPSSSAVESSSYKPSQELQDFLDNGPPPVFVGFGSMVVDDAISLIQVLLDGAAEIGVRMLVQSGWSEISDEDFKQMNSVASMKAKRSFQSQKDDSQKGQYDAFLIGSLPHDWLFPHLKAVIHHGGAGTTAAGLRAGKPTMVCPFFGDQHFWGHMVYRAGVGPEPCSVYERVASGLSVLLSPEVGIRAVRLAEKMNAENGIEKALDAFYSHLHLENMVCDVSIFCGESRIAQVWCPQCRFKMNKEVSDIIHNSQSNNIEKIVGENDLQHHEVKPCTFVNWSASRDPSSPADGLVQGIGGATHEVIAGIGDALMEPMTAIYNGDGWRGAVDGMVHGLQGLLIRPMTGGFVLYNKVSKGLKQAMVSNKNTDVNSKRGMLPNPHEQFTRPGVLSRQADSVYGSDLMGALTSKKKDDECNSKSIYFEGSGKEYLSNCDSKRNNLSGIVSADVENLDNSMKCALKSSDEGAFINDFHPETLKLSELFHSIGEDGGHYDLDTDSGLGSGLSSPSNERSSSIILEESSVSSAIAHGADDTLRQSGNASGEKILFLPLNDSISTGNMEERTQECKANELAKSNLEENKEDLDAVTKKSSFVMEGKGDISDTKQQSLVADSTQNSLSAAIEQMDENHNSKSCEKSNFPSLVNSMVLPRQPTTFGEKISLEGNDSGVKINENSKENREIEILNAFLLATKIQKMLEDVIGTSSRFITFEDFSTMLAEAMGKNWQLPPDDLHMITLKLVQTISDRKEYLDFVDFSLVFLSMQTCLVVLWESSEEFPSSPLLPLAA